MAPFSEHAAVKEVLVLRAGQAAHHEGVVADVAQLHDAVGDALCPRPLLPAFLQPLHHQAAQMPLVLRGRAQDRLLHLHWQDTSFNSINVFPLAYSCIRPYRAELAMWRPIFRIARGVQITYQVHHSTPQG